MIRTILATTASVAALAMAAPAAAHEGDDQGGIEMLLQDSSASEGAYLPDQAPGKALRTAGSRIRCKRSSRKQFGITTRELPRDYAPINRCWKQSESVCLEIPEKT